MKPTPLGELQVLWWQAMFGKQWDGHAAFLQLTAGHKPCPTVTEELADASAFARLPLRHAVSCLRNRRQRASEQRSNELRRSLENQGNSKTDCMFAPSLHTAYYHESGRSRQSSSHGSFTRHIGAVRP